MSPRPPNSHTPTQIHTAHTPHAHTMYLSLTRHTTSQLYRHLSTCEKAEKICCFGARFHSILKLPQSSFRPPRRDIPVPRSEEKVGNRIVLEYPESTLGYPESTLGFPKSTQKGTASVPRYPESARDKSGDTYCQCGWIVISAGFEGTAGAWAVLGKKRLPRNRAS